MHAILRKKSKYASSEKSLVMYTKFLELTGLNVDKKGIKYQGKQY